MTPEQKDIVQQMKAEYAALGLWIDPEHADVKKHYGKLGELIFRLARLQIRVQISDGQDYVVVNFCRFDELKE